MSADDHELLDRARAWAAADPDPVCRDEIEALVAAGDVEGLRPLVGRWLRFGTSGLRARRGPGPSRMNRLVARCVADGVVRWLTTDAGAGAGAVLAVAHDARHGSDRFAADMADVAAQRGLEVRRLPTAVPTPVGVWAGGRAGAAATLVCTASHNPPEDGGVKIYLADGAQPLPPVDGRIADAVAATDLAALPAPGDPPPPVDPSAVLDGYLTHVAGLVRAPAGGGPVLVHTALHGVGGAAMAGAFDRAGFRVPVPVAEQADPDPDFPTVALPNPEEPGALDRAVALADDVGAAAVLASDPDADRLAVAVPAPPWAVSGDPAWVALSGDQVGWLLADHLLRQGEGADRLLVSTVESSRLLARLAADEGVRHVEVPTGFKWIAHAAMSRPELGFVMGYEQALGYAVDDAVRDKDGISAALVAAEVLAQLGDADATVWDALERLARRVGHHATAVRWWRGAPEEARTLVDAVALLCRRPPATVAGRAVRSVVDLADGALGVPVPGVVLDLADGARVLVRPSGTEPKVKVYAEVRTALGDSPGAFADAERAGGSGAAELAVAALDHVRSQDRGGRS